MYGAGDEKLGSIVAPGATQSAQRQIGKLLRSTFEAKIPALGKLQKAVKKMVKRGYLVMPDGRRTYIRHEHAALNSLLQAAGAIICKAWIVEFDKRLAYRFGSRPGGGWDQEWVALGWIHDEVELAVRKEFAEEVGGIVSDSMEKVTQMFNWRLPLEADYSVGNNWYDCH